MGRSVKEMLDEANAAVPRITAAEARRLIAEEDALLLDVRDAPELETAGRAAGSHHVPRGMLEFRADPASPFHDPALRPERPVIVHCASGGRAALAGRTLREMGYGRVWNLGGLKDWVEGGGALVAPLDRGM